MIDMEELIRRLKNTAREDGAYGIGEYGHSYKLLTHSDAEEIIKYLNRYNEISKIIDEFNDAPDVHCGRGNTDDLALMCFERILDVFKE